MSASMTIEIVVSLAEWLTITRRRKGMTQEVLAQQLGISTQYLGNIERGRWTPGAKLQARIVEVLSDLKSP
jgi:transcriptional regulator with XRE-family HTH domain